MKSRMSFGCLALMLLASALTAQIRPDGRKAFEHVKYLASDDFKGRLSGTPEYERAAEYVAEKMAEYGLEPGGENGTYFQQVTFKNWHHFEQPIRLEIRSPEPRKYYAGNDMDFFPLRGTGSGIVQGQLVFAGYGIEADTLGWNDYADLDVEGKIVLFVPDHPDTLGEKGKQIWTIDKRIETAAANGAKGAILINVSAMDRRSLSWRLRRKKMTCPEGFVVMAANTSLINHAFYLNNQSWRYLVSRMMREQKSFTSELDVTVEMEAHYTEVDSLQAPNVIGVIPGEDPVLKEEIILVGGHLDHLGVGIDGFIYNGADDNAGSAGIILELARVFQANGFKPNRTVVFASWAGEEIGLVGSRFYAEHPLFPLEKTAVYMNMDMIGCGDTDIYLGGMWEFSDFFAIVEEALDDEMKDRLQFRLKYRGSDHSAFLPKDVTCLAMRSGGLLSRELDDEHPEYHRPGDMPNIIEPEVLKVVADYHVAVISHLADIREDLFDPIHHIQFVHKDANVVDLHCDTIGRFVRGQDLSEDLERGHVDIPKLKQGAVDLQVFACYVGPPRDEEAEMQAAERAFRQIDGVHRLIEANPDDLALVKSYADFRKLYATPKSGLLIGIEGGYAIENDLALLRSFYRTGVRLMTLTHWTHTGWADASGDEELTFNGLSELGEDVVEEMNRLGMIIDVSHAHDSTFWDVIRLTEDPVVASHSCCRALSKHHRNLTDEMLEALAENDGMIGINFATGFLNSKNEKKIEALQKKIAKKHGLPTDYDELMKADSEKRKKAMAEYAERLAELQKKLVPVDVKTVVDHIEHVIEVTGSADHVGLGSDFDGIGMTPIGLEHVGKLSNITAELLERGHSKTDIRKILGGNFLRILRKVCDSD